jgi:hypothetical protein
MVAVDYGGTGTGYYINTGTATSCATDTYIEYGYEDCTTSASTGRIWCPTPSTVKVRQKLKFANNTGWTVKWSSGTAATTCDEWEVVEDNWGYCWEGTGASNYVLNISKYHSKPLTPEEQAAQRERQLKNRIKSIIDSRCAPNIIIKQNDRRKALPMPQDIREQRARETLKRVVGERKFINFLKSGFLSVKAKSGLVYQIFPGHGITCVFDQGKLVDRLCVVLQGGFPPTDSLIMRYLMILNNESQFRSYAIKHTPTVQVYQEGAVDMRPLAEIYKELKSKVA